MSATTSPPPSRHGPVAQLLIASSPLSLILLSYVVGDWIDGTIDVGSTGARANRLGFGLHETAAATVDRRVFGTVPTVWLQERLLDGSAHWWDAVASLVYATHFVMIPLLTVVVWFRHRDRYRAWIATVLTFTAVGVGGYVAFPASPPWLAADEGLIGPVHRVSGLGWSYLHLSGAARLFGSSQSESNPIAAMPSLHAGSALLVALFLWPLAGRARRSALVAYPLVMALALVYSGEHFVLDVLGGWLTAGVAVAVGRAVLRSGAHVDPARPAAGVEGPTASAARPSSDQPARLTPSSRP